MLEKELCLSKEQISKLVYLKAYPKNLRELLVVQRVFNIDVKAIIKEYPIILHQDINSILETESLLRSYRIPEYAVLMFKKVFVMGPEVLEQRLKIVTESKVNKSVLRHPSFLKLLFRIDRLLDKLPENDKHAQADYLNKVIS